MTGRAERAELQRASMRQRLLTAGTRTFAERGVSATSVADVIGCAGVARGTFYLHFESLDAMFLTILDGFIAQLRDAVQPIAPDHPRPVDALVANLARVIELFEEQPELTKVLLREAVGLSPAVDARLSALYGYVHARVAGALVRGAERGVIRPVSFLTVATAIIGATKELLHARLSAAPGAMPAGELVSALMDLGYVGLRST